MGDYGGARKLLDPGALKINARHTQERVCRPMLFSVDKKPHTSYSFYPLLTDT
jgi:hypothetical protein